MFWSDICPLYFFRGRENEGRGGWVVGEEVKKGRGEMRSGSEGLGQGEVG